MPRTPYPCRTCGKPRPAGGQSKPDGQCRSCASEQRGGYHSPARTAQQLKLKANFAVPKKAHATAHPGSWWTGKDRAAFQQEAQKQASRIIAEGKGSAVPINTVDSLQ
jgi:hypothetical protein